MTYQLDLKAVKADRVDGAVMLCSALNAFKFNVQCIQVQHSSSMHSMHSSSTFNAFKFNVWVFARYVHHHNLKLQ